MTVLTGRVWTAADNNAAAIGTTLADKLKLYKGQWTTARNNQLGKMAVVDDNRTERSQARIELELVLLHAIHRVAYEFVGDIEKGSSYVDFNLLYAQTHHAHKNYSGTIPAGGFAVVVNRSFTDEIKIHGKNTNDNADLRILLLHDTTAIPTTGGKIIKAGKSKTIKPSAIGSLDDTFLVIVNLSTVNELTWAVEITG